MPNGRHPAVGVGLVGTKTERVEDRVDVFWTADSGVNGAARIAAFDRPSALPCGVVEWIPAAESVMIPMPGHLPWIDDLESIARRTSGFLGTVAGGTATLGERVPAGEP